MNILDDLSALHHKYDEKWSAVVKQKENHDTYEQLRAEQTELERISEHIQAAPFGLEHIMREISQIYESCSSVKKNKKTCRFTTLIPESRSRDDDLWISSGADGWRCCSCSSGLDLCCSR